MKIITVNQTGPSEDAFKAAFIRALEETFQVKGGEILILVPQKSNLEHGIIEKVLGAAIVKKLLKNENVQYGPININIRARTMRTVEIPPRSEVIIGAYIKPSDFDGVLAKSFATVAAIYVPWLDDEFEAWKSKNAEIINVSAYLAKFAKQSTNR